MQVFSQSAQHPRFGAFKTHKTLAALLLPLAFATSGMNAAHATESNSAGANSSYEGNNDDADLLDSYVACNQKSDVIAKEMRRELARGASINVTCDEALPDEPDTFTITTRPQRRWEMQTSVVPTDVPEDEMTVYLNCASKGQELANTTGKETTFQCNTVFEGEPTEVKFNLPPSCKRR